MKWQDEKKIKTEPFLIQQNINRTINQEELPHNNKKTSFYSRFQIPPRLDRCYLHQNASSFGANNENEGHCPCCNEGGKSKLNFSCKLSQIYKINEPVGFYFTFIKMMVLGLSFTIIVPGVYSIIEIISDCGDSSNCDYVYGVPVPKLKAYYTKVSLLLNTLLIIIQYVIIGFLFYWNIFIHEKMSLYYRKAADEHVFLTGLNHAVADRDRLLREFKDYQVEEVIYTHRVGRYLKLFAEKYKIEALKRKFQDEGKTKKVNQLNSRLRKIDNEIIPIKNKIELGEEAFFRTDKAFIRFGNSSEKLRFEKQYKRGQISTIFLQLCSKSDIQIDGCNIYVERLGDPREIIWENLQVSSMKRIILILVNNIILLVILGASYYFVVLLNYAEQESVVTWDDIVLSVLISIIIELINFILAAFIDFSSEKEGRYTITGLTSAVLIKKILVYFINTTLIPFSMFIIQSFRPIEEDQLRNIFTLFLFSNFVTPIVSQFLPIGFIFKLYQRYRIRKQGKDCLKTQISANKIFQKMSFNLQQRYGLLCQRMMNCCFYAAIFPIAGLITMFGFIFTYVVSKYQLVNNCALPRHSFRLGKLITHTSAIFPSLYAIGYVVNLIVYRQEPTYDPLYCIILAVCTVIISLIFIIFGNQFIRKRVSLGLNDVSKIHVREEVTYKDLNPSTFMTEEQRKQGSNVSLLKNLMQYSVFRQGINIQRLSRSSLSRGLQELMQNDQTNSG